ncbi:MAG: transposase [Ilumatobacteraceae bacterium]|nr:transposase [Ilumatobacteraceae bacterium]
MARAHRINIPDTWHHVTNRGADRQDIFTADPDRLYFEALLGDITERFSIEIHAYCLMGNHFHLLVHCPTGELSVAIQHLSSTYATHYNRTYKRSGPMFEGRFHSVLIDSDEQLARTSRYVHRNPLALTSLRALAAYRWSSYGPYLGHRKCPQWLHRDTIGSVCGFSDTAYRAFVESPQPADTTAAAGLAPAFPPSSDDIERAICNAAGVGLDSLHLVKRAVPNHPRLLAMLMMTESRAASTEELADRFGLSSASSVRGAARRARILMVSEPTFASLHQRATEHLDPAA